MIDMGISRTSTVLEAWTNRRRRRHRVDCLRSMEEMLALKRNSRTNEQDRVLWKGKNGVFRPTLSTKDTWNHTRTTANKVSWHKRV
jgi:urease accessory protein UreE